MLWAYQRELKKLGWELDSKLGGYNSYYLHKDGDPREWHFRWWRGLKGVAVNDAYRMGRPLGVLKTEGDVARFLVIVGRSAKKWW